VLMQDAAVRKKQKKETQEELEDSDYLPEPRVPRERGAQVIGKDANHPHFKEE